MSKYSDLEARVKVLERWAFRPVRSENIYKFKARAMYLDEPISPWYEGILTLQPLVNHPETAKWVGSIEIPLQNCTANGVEMEGPHGTRRKERTRYLSFASPGIFVANANWDEVI